MTAITFWVRRLEVSGSERRIQSMRKVSTDDCIRSTVDIAQYHPLGWTECYRRAPIGEAMGQEAPAGRRLAFLHTECPFSQFGLRLQVHLDLSRLHCQCTGNQPGPRIMLLQDLAKFNAVDDFLLDQALGNRFQGRAARLENGPN